MTNGSKQDDGTQTIGTSVDFDALMQAETSFAFSASVMRSAVLRRCANFTPRTLSSTSRRPSPADGRRIAAAVGALLAGLPARLSFRLGRAGRRPQWLWTAGCSGGPVRPGGPVAVTGTDVAHVEADRSVLHVFLDRRRAKPLAARQPASPVFPNLN